MKGVRHDINKRRTLRRKNDLLKTYGVRCLAVSYSLLAMYMFNNWLHPPEYRSEEEAESKISNLIYSFRGLKKL